MRGCDRQSQQLGSVLSEAARESFARGDSQLFLLLVDLGLNEGASILRVLQLLLILLKRSSDTTMHELQVCQALLLLLFFLRLSLINRIFHRLDVKLKHANLMCKFSLLMLQAR